MVSAILPLVALFQVFDGTSAVTGGIFRAKGQQFTGALLNLRYASSFHVSHTVLTSPSIAPTTSLAYPSVSGSPSGGTCICTGYGSG